MRYKNVDDLAHAALDAIQTGIVPDDLLSLAGVYYHALANAPDGLTGKWAIGYAEEKLIMAQVLENLE